MRRLTAFIVLLVGGVGVALWLSQSFVNIWEPQLRARLEQGLGDALHARVQIAGVSMPFFHRLKLTRVEMWSRDANPKQILFADDITLTISLIDLPRALWRRQPLESIGLIHIQAPRLQGSPEVFPKFSSSSKKPRALPVWFTVAWDDGTFQWADPNAPNGQWTLRQAEGAFRIRGPKLDFETRGSLDQAQTIRIEWSALRHRWNGRLLIVGGDLEGVLSAAARRLPAATLPKSWTARGRFNLEVLVGGHHFPTADEKPLSFIERGRLTFLKNTTLTVPGAPSLGVGGSLTAEGTRLTVNDLKLSFGGQPIVLSGHVWPLNREPRATLRATASTLDLAGMAASMGRPGTMEGHAGMDATFDGPLSDPTAHVSFSSPGIRVGRWSVSDAALQGSYREHAWNLDGNRVRFGNGSVTLKGHASKDINDITLTAENITLPPLAFGTDHALLRGILHGVMTFQGPWDDGSTSGSFWVNRFSWQDGDPTTVRGRLEYADAHLQLSATSEDGNLQFAVNGSHDDDGTTLDHISLHLPDGSTLTGAATLKRNGPISGAIDVSHVPLTGALVPLDRWVPGLEGTASGHARLSGTSSEIVLKGNFESNDLTAGGDTLGHGQTSLEWSKGHLSLPAFKLSSGIVGGWTVSSAKEWIVRLIVTHAPAGPLLKLVAPKSTLPGTLNGNVSIDPRGMEWRAGEYDGPWASFQAVGHGKWISKPGDTRLENVLFDLDGNAHSPDASRVTWHFPFRIKGHWMPGPSSNGEATVEAKEVSLQGKSTDPFRSRVSWTSQSLSWSDTMWGPHWNSDGVLTWPSSGLSISGALHIVNAPLSLLAGMTGWSHANEAEGLLNGTFTVKGPLKNMSEHLAGRLDQARWRKFMFHSTVAGDWNAGGQSSVQADGALDEGGQFAFLGAFNATTNQIQGGLKLLHFNLKPLGESLAFPQRLEGTAAGLLTVSGPLSGPQLTGRLQGGPISYGAGTPHPVVIDNYNTTLTIGPSPTGPGVTRLTVTDGLVKTPEELIRIGEGSFVDYAPNAASRLRIVTELRNVHLGVFTLFGGLSFDGNWQIKPKGFAITADASTHSLFINDYELEEGHINADYYDNVIRFSPPDKGHSLITGSIDLRQSPQIHFTQLAVAGKEGQGLQLSGDIGPTLWNFQMTGHGLDIGTLAGLAGFPYSLDGTAHVALKGTGNYKNPHVEGSVELNDGNALGLNFKTGSAEFLWQNDRITFTQLWLAYPGRFKLLGNGGFPITPTNGQKSTDQSVDFSVRLQDSNLGLLQSLSNEVKKAKGPVQGLLQITGTSDKPVLKGSLRITDGDIVGAHYIRHLKNLLATVDFSGEQLLIRELQGDSEGGGTLLAGGSVTLQGLTPRAYDLRADITSKNGLAVQVPELAIPESPLSQKFHFLTSTSQAVVKGHVAFKGPADAPDFKADVVISRGHFTFPPSHKNPPPAAVLEWFRRINWDVKMKFEDGAWFDNELVQAAVLGSLSVKGTSDRLRVDGGLDINEGEISYLGLDFAIREARFDMRSDLSNGTIENTPYMRGVADSTVQAVDTLNGATPDQSNRQSVNDTITLNIDYAPIDQIKPRLTSAANPNLSQEKVLERVTQMDVADLTPQERNTVYQQQMVQIIDTSLARPLAKSILKRTGLVDNVRVQRVIDPASAQTVDPVTGAITTPTQSSTSLFANTKYTFEKELSNRVSLGYGIRFVPTTTATASSVNATTDSQNKLDLVSDVQLSYRWFRNVYVRGDVDLPNSDPNIVPDRRVTIEPRWRFGWWGNTNKDKIKPAPAPVNSDRGQ